MLTRGVTTSFSRNAVFNTHELLENILFHLDSVEGLLTTRHINHHWNAVILTSPRLQSKMWLRPAPKHGFWVLDTRSAILRKYKVGDKERFGDEWAERQNIMIPAKVNPLLFRENTLEEKGCLEQRARVCESIRLKAAPDLSNLNSIYHKMLVAIPPPKVVEFEFWFNHDKKKKTVRGKGKGCGDWYVRAKVKNKAGVTFGDVVRKFLAKAAEEGSAPAEICVKGSAVWMLGVIHPTEEEVETVERLSN